MTIDVAGKTLLRRLVLGALLLLAAERVLNLYGPRHFVPTQTLAAARGTGDDCLLYTGDSRTVAGIDAETLRRELGGSRGPARVADVSVRALDVPGQVIMLRSWLDGDRRPGVVMLGVTIDSLIRHPGPPPSAWAGPQAVKLVRSRRDDVFLHFPGWPRRDVLLGADFLVRRTNAFHGYESILWERAQHAQSLLTGAPPMSRFGGFENMPQIAPAFERQALALLSLGSPWQGWTLSPWFQWLRRELRARAVPLVLVELPMPERFRERVSRTAAARALRTALEQDLRAEAGRYVDFSDSPTIHDGDFGDPLHLRPQAARRFTAELAAILARDAVLSGRIQRD